MTVTPRERRNASNTGNGDILMVKKEQRSGTSFIKIVYFDEESASDLLDVSAGGRTALTTEQVKERVAEMHGKAEANVAAKFG